MGQHTPFAVKRRYGKPDPLTLLSYFAGKESGYRLFDS
jgi:hypothetical protein